MSRAPIPILLLKSRGWFGPAHGGTHVKRGPVKEAGSAGAKPETGPFGPVFRQFRHNAAAAIAHLSKVKTGEAVAALYHPEIGDIDLVWGETNDDRHKKGHGLAKIVRWHSEVLPDMQRILKRMKASPEKNKSRVNLRWKKYRASVRLDAFGAEKRWLLTMYEKGSE